MANRVPRWQFKVDGVDATVHDLPKTVTIIDGMDYRPPAERAKLRPANYLELEPEEQWTIDKQLGILDWDGSPNDAG
jgi:hypothetical protein